MCVRLQWVFKDGTTYVGTFEDGPTGPGTYVFANGTSMVRSSRPPGAPVDLPDTVAVLVCRAAPTPSPALP